jgi:hypothetical protein
MIAAQGQAAGTLQRLQAGRQRVADLIAARKRALDAQLASMSAALRPFQEQVAHMQEAIWSVSLYLGGTKPAGVHQRRRQRLSAGSTLTIELQNSSAGMGAMMSRRPLATRLSDLRQLDRQGRPVVSGARVWAGQCVKGARIWAGQGVKGARVWAGQRVPSQVGYFG